MASNISYWIYGTDGEVEIYYKHKVMFDENTEKDKNAMEYHTKKDNREQYKDGK